MWLRFWAPSLLPPLGAGTDLNWLHAVSVKQIHRFGDSFFKIIFNSLRSHKLIMINIDYLYTCCYRTSYQTRHNRQSAG